MLPRILEPEVMDTLDEARDYDAMDHAEVNRRFVEDLLPLLPGRCVLSNETDGITDDDSPPLELLDLGTGTAQIPVELCRRTQNLVVVAVDAAANMLDIARLNVEVAGLRERIWLDRADAKRLEFAAARFDGVLSNSIIHHVPEPIACLREAVRVVKPDGLMFFRDLLRPATAEELSRLVDLYAAPPRQSAAGDHQRAMFAASLHAALTLDEVRQMIQSLGFAADTVRQTSDRHWTWSAVMYPSRSA